MGHGPVFKLELPTLLEIDFLLVYGIMFACLSC